MLDKLVCVQDFEDEALQILDKNARNYFKSGADDEVTLQENKDAFSR
jgi:(S)-2-hydroxy-acid oxidase